MKFGDKVIILIISLTSGLLAEETTADKGEGARG
jgi:hypothetical protein